MNVKKKRVILSLMLFIAIPANYSYCQNKIYKLTGLNSRYIVLMDYKSGRVLFERDSKKIVPMASTTKIITAIIALENSDIHEVVTVSKRASSIQGSTIGLKNGQKLTMEELLYGLMMRSGNDCAIAISEHIGGSVEKFAFLMDSKAFDMGAFDTHFSTPHGLDSDGHFTTAYDLALITKYAMGNESFAKIVSTKDVTLQGFNGISSFHNINKILWQIAGADGVKTGYTGKAGKCLVSSASQNGRRVICVTLDCSDRWKDSKALLEYGLNNYSDDITIHRDEHYSYIYVNNGKKSSLKVGFNDDMVIPVSEDEKKDIYFKKDLPSSLDAPLYKNQQVGSMSLYSNGKKIYSVPIKALEDVDASFKIKGFMDRILEKLKK